jgi:aminoglycoside/choline kinase family phosphotransferase
MRETDARLALIQDWLTRELRLVVERLEPASADASFRRYFRATLAGGTRIVMDAPPGREDVRPYLRISRMLESVGMHVPHLFEADESRGLLLLEDLGSTHYLSRLKTGGDPDALYGDALDALAGLQARGGEAAAELRPYDREPLMREMGLLPEWFCARHLGLTLTQGEQGLLERTFDFLVEEALVQPQVFVHRDYHSRNLMVLDRRNPGVLDFQDALRGPIGYDLVSLLKDCYIAWPRERVERWLRGYRDRVSARGVYAGRDEREFIRWFDLIGVQRHVKVLGIFARLWYRDGKPGYLPDLPLTLAYVRDAAGRYPELSDFSRFVEERLVPELPRANERALAQLEPGA